MPLCLDVTFLQRQADPNRKASGGTLPHFRFSDSPMIFTRLFSVDDTFYQRQTDLNRMVSGSTLP